MNIRNLYLILKIKINVNNFFDYSMNLYLKIKIIIFLLLILLLYFTKNEHFSNMPGNKDSTQQIETEVNLSKFKKIDDVAHSMIMDINGYYYTKNNRICYGPTGCKNNYTKEFGFKPEEIERYEINDLVKNNQIKNEDMVPFILEGIKKLNNNFKEQTKTLDDIKQKIDKLENQ